MFLTFSVTYLMFNVNLQCGERDLRALQAEPTISSMVLLSLYNDLSSSRDVFDHGLAKFGISLQELQDFHGYISLRSFVRIFEWLADELADPCLGLTASQRSGPDALGAVGYLFLSSGKLETALQSLIRYLEAIQSSSMMEIRYIDDFVEVRYRIIDDSIAPRRQDSEYSIGLIWRYMKLLSKNRCRLSQVCFEHEQPAAAHSIYRRTFNAPVLFDENSNALTLPLEDIRQWHDGLDPHLFPILEDHITNTLKQSDRPGTFTESVKQLLTEQVLQQGARADLIADMLNISTVSLYRKLRREDSGFKPLVESRSKEIAERLLQHSNMPIATVSRRLGFSDPAVFTRAFRRWSKKTPRDFRKESQR
jgi:AraC-like DNA-binding protein